MSYETRTIFLFVGLLLPTVSGLFASNDAANSSSVSPNNSLAQKSAVLSLKESIEYRREFIVNMTKEAWSSYVQHNWGQEGLRPQTHQQFEGTLAQSGGTILAAMSTLWLMNLTSEFEMGREWIRTKLNYS